MNTFVMSQIIYTIRDINAYSREKTTPIFMKGSSVPVVG